MKPRIKPLPKTGDSTPYLVNGQRIVISGFMQAVMRQHSLTLLAAEIARRELDRPTPPAN